MPPLPMIKTAIIKVLAFLNMAEGIIHLITSAISFWGIFDGGISDWRVITAPASDLVLGVVSLLTSYVLTIIARKDKDALVKAGQ